jgi:dipeptidyl aminopeptidase/acylaminoacyl peptidase
VDGSRATVWAEVEVPNEAPLYLMDLDGGAPPTLLTERGGSVMCPIPADAIGILRTETAPWSLERIDLLTGDGTTLADDIPTGLYQAPSADGRQIALATGERGATLTIVDLVDGTSRVLLEDLPDAVARAAWSPDGLRLAVAVGPHDPMVPRPTGPFEVFVVDAAAGSQPHSVLRFDGAAPDLAWSSDGRSLAVRQNDGDDSCCCGAPGRLSVVDVESGTIREVAPDATFVGWSPTDATALAWGTPTKLVVDAGGVAREVKAPRVKTEGGRKAARWSGFTGWSPDGRFLGFGYPRLMTVDVETGAARVLFEESDEASLVDVRWWP